MRIFLFGLLLCFALPGIAQNATVAEGPHVKLRAGKTDNYRVIRILAPGTPLQILESDSQYARVKTQEGDIGWLPTRLLVVEPMDMHPPADAAAPPPAAATGDDPVPVQAAAADTAGGEQNEPVLTVPWNLLLVGGLCFLIGAAVGIAAHEAYYRKRLNGLRI
jgi:hypothetical protein